MMYSLTTCFAFLLSTDEMNMPATMDDFLLAIKKVSKSVGDDDLKKYEAWMTEFGSI